MMSAASAARRSAPLVLGERVFTSATRMAPMLSWFSRVRRRSPSLNMPKRRPSPSTAAGLPSLVSARWCRAAALEGTEDSKHFIGLAGRRNGDEEVVGRDHAEVAVAGLARMHEKRRRPGRGQGRGDLAADMAALAHAGHHHAAFALAGLVQ